MGWRVLTVLLLVFLAGCVSVGPPMAPGLDATTTPVGGISPTGTTTTATTAASEPTTAPVASATQASANPWRADPVVVTLDNRANPDRDFGPLVREAIAYWEGEGAQYATYHADFEYVAAADDPDVVIEVRESVTCAGDENEFFLGCAPVLAADSRAASPTRVQIKAGFSDETTVATIEHEFGHLFGLSHDDEPAAIMTHRIEATRLPEPNATERAYPWETHTLTTYVEYGPLVGSDRDAAETQVGHALDYYDEGADGFVDKNVSFEPTDDPRAANVAVRIEATPSCGDDRTLACSSVYGYDTDDDGALEYYTRLEVVVNDDLDSDAIGWYVGYQLGRGLGAGNESGLPPPFRDASYTERRSAWWV